MRIHPRRLILGSASLVFAGSLIVGAPAAWGSAPEPPPTIDFQQNRVTDASGAELSVRSTSGDEGESTTRANTASGTPVVIVRQSAPVEASPATLPPEASADAVRVAQHVDGSLPAELVGTEYVEGANTQTMSEEERTESPDPSTFALRFVQALTPHSVSFAWERDEGVATTQVLRDGAVVADGVAAAFTETGLETNRQYEYRILSRDSAGEIVGTRMIPVSLPTTSAMPRAARTYQPWVSGFVYRTFIPDSKVNMDLMTTLGCGQAGKTGMTFGGDGRSWVTPPYNTPWDATSFRSSVFININWDNAAPYDVVWTKEVRPTTLYQNGVLKEQRTASADGIKLSNISATSNYAQAHINHAVGNPFCAAGAITYNAWARFYRSGTFEVSGSRFPVPAHEVYGGWDNGNGTKVWRPLTRLSNEGFACLTGVCGSKQLYGSATY